MKKDVDRLSQELNTARQTPLVTPPVTTQSPRSLGVPSRESVDAAQATYDAVLRQVVEEGGSLDDETRQKLSAAQRELTRAEAKFVVEETLLQRDAAGAEENAKWSAVDAYMNERYPDAKNFADEMGLFVKSDPLVMDAITALSAQPGGEVKAAELAWKMFDRARGGAASVTEQIAAQTKENNLQVADQVRNEVVAQARKDAGIISSSASGVHEAPPAGPSQEEINAAAEAMRAYGSAPGNAAAAHWRNITIGRSLPSELFGS